MNAPTRRLLLAAATVLVLCGCSRLDPIGADLKVLNETAQAAMVSADVQRAMAGVQAASSPAEKAAVMRTASVSIDAARASLEKASLGSPEVGDIRRRMVEGFGKLGDGARTAATAFDTLAPAELERARVLMREGQLQFIDAGKDMVTLAKQRSVDLAAKP